MSAKPTPSAGWNDVDGRHLQKTFHFPDWKTALSFVNRIGDVAEAMNHHPDIELGWGKVVVRLSTHDRVPPGVGEKDHLLAERIDALHL
jgi:4a-hydroxytetrahydrobiopterin dehydratase